LHIELALMAAPVGGFGQLPACCPWRPVDCRYLRPLPRMPSCVSCADGIGITERDLRDHLCGGEGKAARIAGL